MAISNTQIETGGNDIFVGPGSSPNDIQEHAVTCIIFCNTTDPNTGVDVTLNVYAVPENSPVNSSTQIIKDLVIPRGETLTFDSEKLILSSQDRIRAVASPYPALTATVSTMRVS
jgi:hypothetical protein